MDGRLIPTTVPLSPEQTTAVGVTNVYMNIDDSTLVFPESRPGKRHRGGAKMGGGLFTSYIDAAMKEAVIKKLEDGTFYAKIPSCPGVWADGDNESECLKTLQEVLEEWLLFKLRDGDSIPVVGNVDLNIQWKEDLSWVGEDFETNQPERAN
jgi:predicted RNase H-like HicB family nuclease